MLTSVTTVPAEAIARIINPEVRCFMSSHPLRAGADDRDETAEAARRREDTDHD